MTVTEDMLLLRLPRTATPYVLTTWLVQIHHPHVTDLEATASS
jgi:hypothetical protein